MFINNNDDEDIPIALSFPNKLKSANFVNRLSSKFYDFNNQKSLLEQEEHDELERLLRKNQNKHLESGKKVLEMTPKEKNSKRMKVDESQNKLENKENNSKDDNFADTKSEAKPNRKKKKFDDNYRKLTMKKKMHFSASAAGKFNLKGSKYKRFQWSKNKQKYEKTGKFGVKPPGELDDQHSNLNLIHFIDPNNSDEQTNEKNKNEKSNTAVQEEFIENLEKPSQAAEENEKDMSSEAEFRRICKQQQEKQKRIQEQLTKQ